MWPFAFSFVFLFYPVQYIVQEGGREGGRHSRAIDVRTATATTHTANYAATMNRGRRKEGYISYS